MYIYHGRDKTYTNPDTGHSINFEAGASLDVYSSIFARMLVGDLTIEEGWDLFKLERASTVLTVRDVKNSITTTLNQYVKEGVLEGSGLED